ncbi:hypothetical protein ACJZ2D_007138 [Fusarium nematophilum]
MTFQNLTPQPGKPTDSPDQGISSFTFLLYPYLGTTGWNSLPPKMSIQITTAPGALLALGLGAGDIASIVSLGRRLGNWWTASSGDEEFLGLLDEDQSSILQRRGLMDVLAFNKRWRKRIRLLANGEPMTLEEEDIKKVMNNVEELIHDLSLFTSVMTCLVAVLEQFTRREHAQNMIHSVLRSLLKLTPDREEILRSQVRPRFNAWRSTACLRGLNNRAQGCRGRLVQHGSIQSGLVPTSESRHVEQFLVWLLGANDACFQTTSSDVAGIAVCLSDLGFDMMHVQGIRFLEPRESICTVMYSEEPFLHDPTSTVHRDMQAISRSRSITVPIDHPWESISVFPVSTKVQNACRSAWKAGQKAAKVVKIGILGPPGQPPRFGSSKAAFPVFT